MTYFTSKITSDKLATYLALRHDSYAYGTYTLWNTQFYVLYSTFKAYTMFKNNGGASADLKDSTTNKSRSWWKRLWS